MTLVSTHIEGLPLVHRGKVRETYAVGDDRLLLVATDRLSAFDVVFDQPIPDKGRVLTQLSAWWFERLADLGPSHFISADAGDLPAEANAPELAGRSMLVRRAERIDAECVVRGYLAGSGWAEYQRDGQVVGHALPAGLREADRLPEPIFTPSTKAEVGHDENITREQLANLVGRRCRPPARGAVAGALSCRRRAGLGGRPDPGRHQVRVRLDRWPDRPDRRGLHSRQQPILGRGPLCAGRIAAELRQAVRARFRGFFRLEQGAAGPHPPGGRDCRHPRPIRHRLQPPDRPGLAAAGGRRLVRWLADVHVRLRPGIADPEGQTITGGLHALGYDSVEEVRAGKLLRIAFIATDHASAEEAVSGMCKRLLANPVMETADWELRAEAEPEEGEIA